MTTDPLPQPEAVIFDIGNVLVTWDPAARFDGFIGRARREAMFTAIDVLAMHERIDRGASAAAVIEETAELHPDYADDIRLWHSRWLDIIGPEIPHSVRLMDALIAAGVPVFALSNFGVETYEIAERAYPFLARFDRHFISGQLRVTKPDPRIYAAVEAATGIAPGRLLFADDMAANVAAAAARGWQAHLFTSPAGWAERLVAAGLIDAEMAA